jgi:hypothetical protein
LGIGYTDAFRCTWAEAQASASRSRAFRHLCKKGKNYPNEYVISIKSGLSRIDLSKSRFWKGKCCSLIYDSACAGGLLLKTRA